MDMNREDSDAELDPASPVEAETPAHGTPGDQGTFDTQPGVPPPELKGPGRQAFDFEMGSEWLDPQSLFRAIAASATTPATDGNTDDRVEPRPVPAVATELPESPTPLADEPRLPSSVMSQVPVAPASEPMGRDGGWNDAADRVESRMEPALQLRLLAEQEAPLAQPHDLRLPEEQEIPADAQAQPAYEQPALPESSGWLDEMVFSAPPPEELSASAMIEELLTPGGPTAAGPDGGVATQPTEGASGEPIPSGRGSVFFPEEAANPASPGSAPPLVIEVVPSRWEQILADLAEQAAQRIAKFTAEEIDSELNLYNHQLSAQLRALLR